MFDDTDRLAEESLGAQAEAEWQRLRRQVELSSGFWLGFLFSQSPRAARIFAARLAAVYRSHVRRLLILQAESPSELSNVLQRLGAADVGSADATWVRADQPAGTAERVAWTQAWETFFLRLNEHRDRLRRELAGGLILEVPAELKPVLRNAAPDLWSIRALVLEPSGPRSGAAATQPRRLDVARTELVESPVDDTNRVRADARKTGAAEPDALTSTVQACLRNVEGLLLVEQHAKAVEVAREALAMLESHESRHPLLSDALAALAEAERADGDPAAALDHYRRLFSLTAGSDDRSLLEHLEKAAESATTVGRPDIAQTFALRQQQIARHRLQQYGDSPQALRDLSVTLDRVGDVRREAGDLSGAQEAYTESLEISRRLLQLYGDSPLALRDLSVSLDNVGDVRREAGDVSGAQGAYTESLEISRRLLQQYGDSPQALRDLSVSLIRVGDVRREAGDLSGAQGAYAESLEIRHRLLQQYGDSPQALRDLSVSLAKVGDVRREAGDVSGAQGAYTESLEISRRLLQHYGDSPQALRDLSVSLDKVGDVRREAGDLSGAQGAYTEGLEISRRLLQLYGESPQALRDLSVSLDNVGNVRREASDVSGAQGAYTKSLEISRRLLQQYGDSPQTLRDLSVSLDNVS